MGFVVRSCLPKITHRLGADMFILKRPLDDILGGWEPLPGDTLSPKRVTVMDAFIPRLPNLPIISVGENQYD
jgi:hypothetical protein